MRMRGFPGRLALALGGAAVAASCATAEKTDLARRGDDDDGNRGGSAGSAGSSGTGGASGASGSAGKGGTTATGGSAGKGGSSGTGGSSGKGGSSTGGSAGAPDPPTYGCIDDNPGGAGGAAGGADEAGAAGQSGGEAGASTGGPGPGGAGPGTGPLFFDDFEDGDADGWTTSGGAWSVVTDGTLVYEQSDNSSNTLRAAGVPGACWEDQVVEARVKVTDFGGSSTSYAAALFGRYLGPTTHYLVGISNGNSGMMFIGKRIESTSSNPQRIAQENSLGIQEGTWYTLRLEIVGSTLRGYLDGTLQVETTDSEITSGGVAVGTSHASARFDEVRVSEP